MFKVINDLSARAEQSDKKMEELIKEKSKLENTLLEKLALVEISTALLMNLLSERDPELSEKERKLNDCQ